ncbi:MAG: DinB family protein, partial [Ignavibacteriota bacterium]
QNVNHLIFWNERYLSRFQDIDLPNFEGSNDSTFEVKAGNSESEWISAKEKLSDILTKWKAALSDVTEEKLNSQFQKSGTWYEVISDITTHNAYHLGQIIHTRKLQGSWIPKDWQVTAPPPQ